MCLYSSAGDIGRVEVVAYCMDPVITRNEVRWEILGSR
jgi:hypothetical protein